MEKEQAKIVYQGIKKKINGKAVFMLQCLHYKGCLEQIVKKLQDERVAEKLKYRGLCMKGKGFAQLTLDEDDLAMLFDELFQGRLAQLLKKTEDPLWEAYALPMSMNGEEIFLDVTYLLVYGIVMNERCRQTLGTEVKERNEYYGYYEKSLYKNPIFESFFMAEQIWDVRLMLGLLERMRQKQDGVDYRLLMKIIYAGYGYLKRQIKSMDAINGEQAKDIFRREALEEVSMLPTVSKTILLMVIAEDLGIRYLWDYDTLVMYPYYAGSVEILANGEGAYEGYEDYDERNHREFLQKYEEKYDTHSSLLGMVCGQENDRLGELIIRIFELYQISPRKFWGHDLSEEEVKNLLRQSERWSQRTFSVGLALAQLCSYIRKLEDQYLAASKDQAGMEIWLARQEKDAACWQRQQQDRELQQILSEKRALEETVLKQEQELSKLQRRMELQEGQAAEHLQELQEMRSYVYSLSEEWEEEETASQEGEKLSGWKDKRVLVVGGHINWQNKLRELFPKWQFILPGQNNLDNSMIKGKDVIICNTEALAHSCYYKILAVREQQQKLYYVHSCNIQRCLKELELQLPA